MNEIKINHLTKQFKDIRALDDVSLTLEKGKIYGLLGRNGAGKSTLLNLITNRIFSDSGEITIDGETNFENDRALQKIYLMSEKGFYPETMKILDIFKWTKAFNAAFEIERALELAEIFELPLKKRVKGLSTGYSSIYKLVIALSFDLPYIFLDEPILGLDANHRDLFYRLLLERYGDEPRTFVLSTHLIEEVSSLIEEVIIINKGKIVLTQSSESLLCSSYTISGSEDIVDAFVQEKNVIGTDRLGNMKIAYILNEQNLTDIPDHLQITPLNLQNLFIQLTNSDFSLKSKNMRKDVS